MKATVDDLGALVGDTSTIETVAEDGDEESASHTKPARVTTPQTKAHGSDRMNSQDDFDLEDF